MKLSIVATLYQSAAYIAEFYERSSAAAQELVGDDFEIVLVNDGSPDNSLEIAVQLTKMDSHVVVVDLSRNFGHHKAMMAGLAHTKGEKIFLIDSDLEEDPSWLIRFSEQMDSEKCDVVYGVQETRKGGWFEKWSGEFYYWIIDWMLDMHHPRNISTVRLMSRQYVDSLLLHEERALVISGLWIITGYRQHSQIVIKKSSSPSTYSVMHKLSHFVNTITSFSSKPLIAIFFTGLAIFLSSLFYVSVIIINRLFFSIPLDGWTSIMASIWLLGGITISFIGVIGIYLSKIFTETKQRPNVIIKDIYGE